MRVIRTVAIVGLVSAIATVAPTAGSGHAQEPSPMCDLVNDPSFDQVFNGAGFAPQQGFAGEMITVSTGPPTVGTTPTATELQVNGAVVASGGLPATLSYTLPADGQYAVVWRVNAGGATWNVSCTPAPPDADADGVLDVDDACADTVLPDQPLIELKPNRFAANADGEFVDGTGEPAGITLEDTAGCSAAQIIAAAGLGAGHSKFGISKGELMAWANQ